MTFSSWQNETGIKRLGGLGHAKVCPVQAQGVGKDLGKKEGVKQREGGQDRWRKHVAPAPCPERAGPLGQWGGLCPEPVCRGNRWMKQALEVPRESGMAS